MGLFLVNAFLLWSLVGNGNSLLPVITNAQIEKAEYSKQLKVWIDKLAHIESGGNADIVVLDSNNLYSYSCMQFQMATFKNYVKRYNLLPNAEDAEIENFIMDCDFQKQLAKEMIMENRDNWKHWYNSTKIIGLPPVNPFDEKKANYF